MAEDLIGVIWASGTLRHGRGMGYGLVITRSRMIGTRKTPWLIPFEHYLGPGSQVKDSIRKKALEVATKLEAAKEFELPSESITKITYTAPGLMSRGYVVFQTAQGDVELTLAGQTPDIGVSWTIKALLPSLAAFAPDRFYSEDTGKRIVPGH